MKVITVRNVQEALPIGLRYLGLSGERRDSRNGPVLVAPEEVTTVYQKPCERVIFWPERDANPFFHLYESLWMLAGRNDVTPLERYVKNSINYSDDGKTLHGAYGFRWRHWFGAEAIDQLDIIADRLLRNPDDRRCILQMWDAEYDLGKKGKDFPCNTIATFQRGLNGELNLVVFCRSNDIIWGAYGANTVQFSMLLEYMALWIGCPVGTYSQISVNYHAYLDMYEKCKEIIPDRSGFVENPYTTNKVRSIPMEDHIGHIDKMIKDILEHADAGDMSVFNFHPQFKWEFTVWMVLLAHEHYRNFEGKAKYENALTVLSVVDQSSDWVVVAQEWINRRYNSWKRKQGDLFPPDADKK